MKKSTFLSIAFGLLGASALTAAVSYGVNLSAPAVVAEGIEVQWTGDPADGSTVDEIDTFTITFDGKSPEDFDDNVDPISFTWNGQAVSAFELKGVRGNTLTFGYSRGVAPLTGEGTMEMTIYAGYLIFSDGTSNGSDIIYTLKQGESGGEELPFSWNATPANNSNVDSFDTFTVVFPGQTLLGPNEMEMTVLWNGEDLVDEYGDAPFVPSDWAEEGNGMVFSATMDMPEGEGTLNVIFHEGYFMLGSMSNPYPTPEFVYTLHRMAAENPDKNYVINPESGSTVADIAETDMTITFPDATEVKLGADPTLIAKWNGSDTGDFTVKSIVGNSVIIGLGRTTNDYSGAGTLNWTLTAGSLLVDGEASPEIVYVIHQGTVQQPVGNRNFYELMSAGYPEPNSFIESEDLMSVVYFMMDADMSINTECTTPAKLKLNDVEIASISATSVEGDASWATAAGGVIEFDFSKADLAEEGTYTVTIPEGFLKADGGDVNAATITYIKGIGTFTPAAGSDVDVSEKAWSNLSFVPFKGVELYEIPGAEQSTFGTDEPMTLTLDGEVIESFPINQQMIFKNKMSLSFKNKITTPGEYVLNVPANYFMALINGVNVGNPAMTLNFNVRGAAAPEQSYTFSPAAGEYKVFPAITVTYENYTGVEVAEGAKATLRVMNVDYITFTITAEGNTVTFTPDEEFSKYLGNQYTLYHVLVPEGSYMLSANGRSWPNEALDLTDYRISAPTAPEFETDPEDGATVESLNTILIAPAVAFTNTNITLTKRAKLFKVEDGVRGPQICTFNGTAASDKTYVTLILPDAYKDLEDGDYEMEVPAGAFSFNIDNVPGIQSPVLVFHYTIKTNDVRVAGIAADENVTVYTMTGVCVMRNAEREALNTLAKGIYVVNGRKVVIK